MWQILNEVDALKWCEEIRGARHNLFLLQGCNKTCSWITWLCRIVKSTTHWLKRPHRLVLMVTSPVKIWTVLVVSWSMKNEGAELTHYVFAMGKQMLTDHLYTWSIQQHSGLDSYDSNCEPELGCDMARSASSRAVRLASSPLAASASKMLSLCTAFNTCGTTNINSNSCASTRASVSDSHDAAAATVSPLVSLLVAMADWSSLVPEVAIFSTIGSIFRNLGTSGWLIRAHPHDIRKRPPSLEISHTAPW